MDKYHSFSTGLGLHTGYTNKIDARQAFLRTPDNPGQDPVENLVPQHSLDFEPSSQSLSRATMDEQLRINHESDFDFLNGEERKVHVGALQKALDDICITSGESIDDKSSNFDHSNQTATQDVTDELRKLDIGLPSEEGNQVVGDLFEEEAFACPFAKSNSLLYGTKVITEDKKQHHRRCDSSTFRSITCVKSHIISAHYWIDFCCAFCFRRFESRISLTRHVQGTDSCHSVKVASQRNTNIEQQTRVEEKQWFDLYKAIFPGQQLPQSPYSRIPAAYMSSGGRDRNKNEAREASYSLKSKREGLAKGFEAQADPSGHTNHFDKMTAGHGPHTDAAWEKVRSVIHDKHIKEGYTLGQLIPYMEKTHSFSARYLPAVYTQQARASPQTPGDVPPTKSGYVSTHPNKQPHTSDLGDIPQDTVAAYSAESVATRRRDMILQTLAKQLFSDMGGQIFGRFTMTALISDLPELLADFALRLGQGCSNPEVTEAVLFIHRNRSLLSEYLWLLLMADPEKEQNSEERRLGDEMSTEDKMWMWQNNLEQDQVEPLLEEAGNGTQLAEPRGVREPDKYIEVLVEHPSYAWLLGRLRNQALLTDDKDCIMSNIRRQILHVLPKTTELRSRCAPAFQVMFEVSWSLRSFLVENFEDSDRVDIGQIITVTGSICNAQALTCEQYIEQTWPSTGIYLIRLLQKIMTSPWIGRGFCRRPDGAVLEAWESDESTICVAVVGTGGVAAEIAEQLSWLSAALKEASRSSKRFQISTPSLYCVSTPPNQHLSKLEEQQRVSQPQVMQNDGDISAAEVSYGVSEERYHFQIGAKLKFYHVLKAEGLCWYEMIHKPIIVRGFPIRRRPRTDLGLEISLKVAAELIGTKYVNRFGGQLFVKGYSAMLVPTLQVGEILVWHLSVSSSGKHESYRNRDNPAVRNIDVEDIGKFRHVVGWCSHALNYAGAADSHYTVRRARLPKADAECVLENNIISFGVLLTSEVPSVLAKQHRTGHAKRAGYLDWFRYFSHKFVLFWDKRDQRGWLVNGISALLHLVRGSLSADERNFAGSDFVLKLSDLREPRQPHSAKAPQEFFSQRENREARISLIKMRRGNTHDEYEILDDRVEQYCHVLEKAITYSEKLQFMSTGPAKGKSAFRLEGWDFVDLVEKVEAIYPCTTILSNVSHAWLELVRSNGITTFFGQGFGELIRPSGSNCCEGWRTLPTGKHYIAANVTDIQQIMDLKGNPDSNPRRLSETLLWHHPTTAFENCGCQGAGEASTKLVQQPCLIRKMCVCPDLHYPDLDLEQHDAGAVIFGYNPEYGPLPDVEDEDEFEDSGLGSSLTGTVTRSSSSVQPTRPESTVRQYGDGNVSGGTGRFGDNIQYIYNYAMPPYLAQHSLSSCQRLGSPCLIAGESVGTKRVCSDAEIASCSSPELQPEFSTTDCDPGPSKRAKTIKPLGPS